MKHHKFSKTSIERMNGVHPRLIEVAHRALEISPIDFGIPQDGGFRTAARQRELFERKPKVTNKDGVVHRSKHQTGRALDFYAFVDNEASWDKHHLAIVGASFLRAAADVGVKLWWGGLWPNFKDYPHVQLDDSEV